MKEEKGTIFLELEEGADSELELEEFQSGCGGGLAVVTATVRAKADNPIHGGAGGDVPGRWYSTMRWCAVAESGLRWYYCCGRWSGGGNATIVWRGWWRW